MKDFKNKIVVITGAGSGMGRAYAEEFGKLGAKLVLNDYEEGPLAETVKIVRSQGVEHIYSETFDVSDKDKMFAFAENVKSKFGNAHIIINNAGIEGSTQTAFHTSVEDFHRIININFFGVVNGTKAFLPQLVENNEGAVVNVSSVFGLVGIPNNADYCASKFAVRGFTEALSVEFHESPISIHCVHPGGIATNIARKDAGQEFSKKYLTTPPKDIAQYVIKCIKSGKPKIVYGQDSFKLWLAGNLVPQRVLNSVVYGELKKVMDMRSYSDFLKK
ncbi:MAG: SDR family oxidoreductase [Flavobacteriales bacterium]|nr:SDR family oxidoreductase [Flavobacteriales bacterium]